MNMTGPAYRSGGKRIPVARPPRRSDPETSTGSASAPDALPGTNRKTMTDSEKASVSSVSAGAPAPARQEEASSTLYPKALKSLEKRIRGYLLKEVKTTYEYDGDGNKRIKNETITRKQVAPDLAAITFALSNLDPQRWRAKSAADTGSPPDNDTADDDRPDLSGLSEQALREISGLSEL